MLKPLHWVFTIFYGPLLTLEAYIIFCVWSCRSKLDFARIAVLHSPCCSAAPGAGGSPVGGSVVALRDEDSAAVLTQETKESKILARQVVLYKQLAGYPYILLPTWAIGTIRRCASEHARLDVAPHL